MCDTMVVVAGGRVLFAKNSDRDPNEAQALEWHAGGVHAPGSRLRCTWIEIDQVRRTHATLLSRPYWMFGAEMGVNEHGVAIGNEAVFTRRRSGGPGGDQDPARPAKQRDALTGMDLVRLGLERATDADEAVEVVVGLLERHGQGGRCGHEHVGFSYDSSFLIADRRQAVVVETAGRHWRTEHVMHGQRSISNGLTIPEFAARHGQRVRTWGSSCRSRRAITEAGAAAADGPAALMAVLRDHGTGGNQPRYSPLNGAMSAPCMHASGIVAASQTTASLVSVLSEDGDRHWATATAAPCTALFKPVSVTEPVDLGPELSDRFDPQALWWRHELLHRRALRDPQRLLAEMRTEVSALEAEWLANPPPSADAFAQAEHRLARWTEQVERELGVGATDRRPVWVRRYWAVRDRRAGIPDLGWPTTDRPGRVA